MVYPMITFLVSSLQVIITPWGPNMRKLSCISSERWSWIHIIYQHGLWWVMSTWRWRIHLLLLRPTDKLSVGLCLYLLLSWWIKLMAIAFLYWGSNPTWDETWQVHLVCLKSLSDLVGLPPSKAFIYSSVFRGVFFRPAGYNIKRFWGFLRILFWEFDDWFFLLQNWTRGTSEHGTV